MPASEQRALDSLYWTLAQPLLVTDRDEPHTEFHARITYARIRWNDPDLGRDGLDTHRGLVYVRYGPPETVAVFNRSEIHWIYWRSRLRFQFRLAPGFANARLGDESQEAFDIASRSLPARFDNIPAVRNLDTIATQVAQFRGENDRTDVAVFGWVPVDRMIAGTDLGDLALNTALILMNDGGEVGRTPRAESVSPDRAASGEHRSWRVTLPAGEFLMRLEAHAPTIDAGARHSSIVNVRSYRAPALAASDLLLARRLAPRDTNATRWTEFFIEPSAGRIAPGEPVSLLWELYNLTPDASGIARWHVELRVTVAAVERRTWAAQLLGGIGDAIGSSAVGDDRITLSWDREAVQASRGARAEWVTLDFGAAPAGTYTITIVVTDLVSRQTVETSRVLERTSLTVGENP